MLSNLFNAFYLKISKKCLTNQIHPTHFRGAAAVANATVLAPLQWSADLCRYAFKESKVRIISSVLLLLVFLPSSVLAESYLCIPAKSVALLEDDSGKLSSSEVDVSATKYLLKKEEGSWVLKEFGSSDHFPCVTQYFCTCGTTAWCGQFISGESGKFTYYLDRNFNNGKSGSQIVKGQCEKIN